MCSHFLFKMTHQNCCALSVLAFKSSSYKFIALHNTVTVSFKCSYFDLPLQPIWQCRRICSHLCAYCESSCPIPRCVQILRWPPPASFIVLGSNKCCYEAVDKEMQFCCMIYCQTVVKFTGFYCSLTAQPYACLLNRHSAPPLHSLETT